MTAQTLSMNNYCGLQMIENAPPELAIFAGFFLNGMSVFR
jgi:hypothetical protein